MPKKILTFLLLMLCIPVFSQGWLPIGARSNSLANATVADVDVWSYYHNPGALGYIDHAAVGASYEDRFLLKELQTQALVYVQPLKVGVLSVGIQSFGYQVYRANKFGVGYSMKLHEKVSMGVQLNYQDIRTQGYNYIGTVTAEVGILAKLTKQLNLGFSVMNINRAKEAKIGGDRFGTFFRLGLQYKPINNVAIFLEAEKEIHSKIQPKLAVEYQVAKNFFLRVGAAYNPPQIAFGLGYAFNFGLNLDAGSQWTQNLGWSPHIGLTYHFKKKVKSR